MGQAELSTSVLPDLVEGVESLHISTSSIRTNFKYHQAISRNVSKGAPEAVLLYAETLASVTKRENAKATGEGEHALRERGAVRPTKRQLRDIKKFTGGTY